MARYPTYTVAWSEEDSEFVATCDWMPSMSWLDRQPGDALNGLLLALMAEDDALGDAGEEFNRRPKTCEEAGDRCKGECTVDMNTGVIKDPDCFR